MSNNNLDVAGLRSVCRGDVVARGDEGFLEAIHGSLWNRLIPDRAPDVVVRVADEQDVIAAVKFAKANGLKVAVRGGGHNWCQPSLRNSGVLVDLSDLNKVISIDVGARLAVVQPIISNRDGQKALNEHGLAFPTGHCPQVKLSGYLLGGGMSWNQGVWGHGADNMEAVELVTSEGELITASATQNQDYFWAARGSGSGFFGVATRYHLRLHPLPPAIYTTLAYYPLEEAVTVAAWLSEIAPKLASSVELSLFLLEAPAELQDKAAAHNGKVCLVTATCFADTPEQGKAELALLQECPVFDKKLSWIAPEPILFEGLFDASGALWPEGLRNNVEAIFSNADGGVLVETAIEHIVKSPSRISLILFVYFTGDILEPLADGAFSMKARIYGGPWTMWKDAGEDAENIAWHHGYVAALDPHVHGHYIGESNTVLRPSAAARALSPENFHRLADLRAKYDPDGVFFGFFDGLGPAKS